MALLLFVLLFLVLLAFVVGLPIWLWRTWDQNFITKSLAEIAELFGNIFSSRQ